MAAAAKFVPRAAFPKQDSLPRTYFIGHHRSAMEKMKTLLSSTDLIIECRDFRIPLSSWNPLFEEQMAEKQRILVYTKTDLGSNRQMGMRQQTAKQKNILDIMRSWHHPSPVFFTDTRSGREVNPILSHIKSLTETSMSLAGMRVLVVGMPNIGKSTLLNSLRAAGVGRTKKAAMTGAQPGITRSIGTAVKIIDGGPSTDAQGNAIETSPSAYLIDSPGVFVPYTVDSEAMLKLALCRCVLDALIQPLLLADYLLYHMNLVNPNIYSKFHEPTNDIEQFLKEYAKKTGKLQKGGGANMEAAALRLVQEWREGRMGRFVLDEITEDAMEKRMDRERTADQTWSQAKKADMKRRREKSAQKQAAKKSAVA